MSTSESETPSSRWDVYRDRDGNPVTITPQQCEAIRHALRVWADVVRHENYYLADHIAELSQHAWDANLMKSCLMGRMLYQGRPPLDEKPPVVHAAPAYHLVDPDLCPQCGGERSKPGGSLATSILPPDSVASMYHQTYGRNMGKTVTRVMCNEDWHPRG